MAKNKDSSNPATRNIIGIQTTAYKSTRAAEADEDVMDIEACIDNPILAPLGRHVNKRRTSKRSDKSHIDINVVRPSSPATFIQEQERESHAPVTSLILRRRRLDCSQLEHYLQNLLPTLDPRTMCTLQSPLLHLTELDLSRNRLEALPADMTSLVPYLSYLNLSHNQFTEIPMELCRLTNLQALIMSQNRIEGPVPPQICASLAQLKTLRLCANQITSLPHTLARLNKLESLSMGSVYGGNLLTAFPADCIQHMSALRELDLSHNKLCFLPADIGHVHSHLRQLTASDNKLEAIPKSIGLCKELRSLNLGRNQLTSLPTEIADLKQLDTLDLSENLLCVIPGDVADFLTKTTLLLTGNPFTRGYCDASRNPVSEIGGLGVNYNPDEERYAAVLKSLSRRAILNSAASTSSSGTHTPTLANLAGGRESPRLGHGGEGAYEMDQDERLDYHLYYTRHALSSRPPSRAGSVSSLNEADRVGSDYGNSHGGSWMESYGPGTGTSTPRVNMEAVISDIDSFFDYPSLSNSTNTMITTAISPRAAVTEPSIFEGTSLSTPSVLPSNEFPLAAPSPTPTSVQNTALDALVDTSNQALLSQMPIASPVVGLDSSVIFTPSYFPSLKELAARTVLHNSEPLPIGCIPEAVIDYLQPGARPCGLCRGPYVKEWVSSVRVKSYLGHPSVVRRVRFCSVACWKAASEQLEAEEAGKAASSAPPPGATTGHLPPVVRTDFECELSMSGLDSALPSPTTPSTPSGPSQQPLWSSGMRMCKGGQSYWPVIERQRTGRSFFPESSSTANTTRQHAKGSSSIAKTNVCSGGCLGGGVCEW
ncbi:hypothetical protein BGZ54_006191 [Gamsiella multidivaricata]|nr:hypothetical protein BGZ54_006191 [Gamsiella multidivaricata]